MPSQTREQLKLRLQELGEMPPSSWKKPQLEARLAELTAAQEMTQEKIAKKMLSELNKASKKKCDLQAHVRDQLQVPVTGSETPVQGHTQAIMAKVEPSTKTTWDSGGSLTKRTRRL